MYGLLIIVALLVGGFALLNRPHFIPVAADIPIDFPAGTFSHRDFESLLEKYVDQDGNVDYAGWLGSPESVSTLNGYLAAVSAYSPDATPEKFSSSIRHPSCIKLIKLFIYFYIIIGYFILLFTSTQK